MRTVTVDTQGLFFTLKIALVVALFGAGWYAWEPVSTLVRAEVEEDATVASAAVGTHRRAGPRTGVCVARTRTTTSR